MNALGKQPIIPAFQLLSGIAVQCQSCNLSKQKKYTVESNFNTIITVDEPVEFTEVVDNNEIKYIWYNFDGFGGQLDFESSVELRFKFNHYRCHMLRKKEYYKKVVIKNSSTELFANLLGLRNSIILSDMWYLASLSTFVMVLDWNEEMSGDKEATPFYKYIRLSFNQDFSCIPKSVIYEYDVHFEGKRTLYYFFRVIDDYNELINGELKVDYISKKSLLRFTKDN